MPRTPIVRRETMPRPRAAESVVARRAASPQLYCDLAAVGLCTAGLVLGLALVRPGSAGAVGEFFQILLRLLIGHGVFLAPVLFVAASISLAADHKRCLRAGSILGAAGLTFVLLAWLHLMAWPNGGAYDSTAARFSALFHGVHSPPGAIAGRADGGLFGAVATTLLSPLGLAGSYVMLVALGLSSVLVLTEITLATAGRRMRERSRRMAGFAAGAVGAPGRALALRKAAQAGGHPFIEFPGSGATDPGERGRHRGPVDGRSGGAAPAASGLDERRSAEARARRRTPTVLSGSPALPASHAAPDPGDYVFPPLDLLDAPRPRPKKLAEDTEANIAILESTLGQFRIDAQVVEIADGPTVTRYEIRLGEGIRVKKILDLADNIAMSLAAMAVRVEAPIPGKSAIGIEVPKKQPAVVTLRECLDTDEFMKLESRLVFALGQDVAGVPQYADLTRMPHLLVAGATNSGKSVCLNVLIASMLFRARPEELKMIMIDPKRVELTLFEGIPHLIHPVVKDVKQAAGILRWTLKEMERRYDLFARVMTRNIEGYNAKVADHDDARLPFIVVIIDELADLMMLQGPEVEQSICRLAQLARATGIHLVIATQRPSVDVITGLIKANIPSRIAFTVTSHIDSRTILDSKGAESLIGRGDMLFKPVDAVKPLRVQGAFLSEAEVGRLVNHLREQGPPAYVAEPISVDSVALGGRGSEEDAEDELFEPAARFIVTTGHASTSMIQRKFKIGYTRAARLVDMMETRGILGPLDGARPREILISAARLDEMFRLTRESLFNPGDEEVDEPEDDLFSDG